MPSDVCIEQCALVPYKKFGRDLSGLDCYGFVRLVLMEHGITLPEYNFDESKEQKSVFLELIPGVEKTTPRDYNVIYINSDTRSGHIGVYLDGDVWHMTRNGLKCEPWKRISGRVKVIYEIEG